MQIKQLRDYQHNVVETLKDRLRAVKHPLLITMSVGAGKSLCIAQLLLWIEKHNYQALCLTMNSTLIEQNANTYKTQGGNPGIYCASLNAKETEQLVIFGSPHSVAQAIRNKEEISRKPFNLIVIDECHNVSPHDDDSMYMRIINHFGLLAQTAQYSYRIVGLTGTPYRGKNVSIVGKDQLFKEEICNISASQLISQGYLVSPQFGLPVTNNYDFSKLRINNLGNFNATELQKIIDENDRLTGQIMRELTEVMKSRRGAFVFCCTRKHCEEAYRSLPEGQAAIITGDTPHEERKRILNDAQAGVIRYLLSVNCLNVGVDVPPYDVCAWIRPTESLILYTQGIGRVLRLSPGKSNALVLDFAGNLERHGDIDDPIINQALQPRKENEQDYVIPCLSCGCSNTIYARRCIGIQDSKRCLHYFEWKDCHACQERNDKCSRYCRRCNAELIDPNAKLSLKAASQERFNFDVLKGHYWVQESLKGPVFHAHYETKQGLMLYEQFSTKDDQCCNIFYGKFVRHQVKNSSRYYPCLNKLERLQYMLKSGDIMTPHQLVCVDKNDKYVIQKRVFLNETIAS